MLTPREQVLAALAGKPASRVPFVIWDNKLPGGPLDRQLLDLGLCVIVKTSVTQHRLRGVEVARRECIGRDGVARIRTDYMTPAGPLHTIHRPMPGTLWQEKHLFGGPEDYPAVEAYLSAWEFTPDYERFLRDDARYGDQSIGRPGTLRNPLQEVAYELMGIETFAIEWAENRPRVLRLMEIIEANLRRQLDLLAASPAKYVVVDGNTDVHTIGLKRFEDYALPHIQRAHEVLQAAGKFAGSHLDGDNRLLAPLIARTSLDFIESFTPPPDCDLGVSEALAAWPDKTIVLNFPSSVHLRGVAPVLAHAREILAQARGSARFIFGISEDIPDAARQTLVPLADLVAAHQPESTIRGFNPLKGQHHAR